MELTEIVSKLAEFRDIFEITAVVGAAAWAVWLWARGILPALIRLGNGLAKAKIAIFAQGNELASLKSLLTDSTLLKAKNIVEITMPGDVGRAGQASLFLVHWPDWASTYQKILDEKNDGQTLVVYAPHSGGDIPPAVLAELNERRNTTVVRFRGRLLNDIVTAMITTGYLGK